MPDNLNKVEELARRWHCSRGHIYNLIRNGELPVVKIGRSTRISDADADAFIASHTETAA